MAIALVRYLSEDPYIQEWDVHMLRQLMFWAYCSICRKNTEHDEVTGQCKEY